MSSLTSVTIPNSVTTIGGSAFYGCTGLTSVNIPNSVTTIGSYAFDRCSGLTSVTIPNSVTTIGTSAFAGCSGLTSVIWNAKSCADFSSSNSPFYSIRTNIQNFTFGEEVEKIPAYLCYGMSSLTSVTIPNSVTTIGGSAFYGCTGLTSVNIPNSVTEIDYYAFKGCTGLTSIVVDNGNSKYDSRNNCNAIIETSTNTLISGCNNTIIPNSVTEIENYAFMDCTGLTSVTIPNSVTTIGGYAFYGCSGLNKIYSNIVNPNNVTLGSYVFQGVNKSTCTLIVPAASYYFYKSASPWKDFLNIVRDVLVTSISIIPQMSLYLGQTYTLSATISPSNAYSVVNWTSSNTTVATIDQSGLVTAKKLGTATITATATDGSGVSASCVVTVTGAESVILNKEEVSMYIGDTETLTATVYPDGLINKTLSWSSSKTSVATVDQNGLVIAMAPGTATITATATDGSGVSASCVVNVVPEYTMSVDTLVHIRGTERVARTVDINLDNREAISGVQFDITLPNYVELATANGYPDMWLDDARKARNHSVDINLIGAKKYRVVVSSPTNKTFKGNEGAILHFNVLVDQFHSIGTATINLSNIVLAEADETQHTIGSVTSDVRFVYLVGDANADTRVDIADYVLTANKIMVRPVSNFWSDAANANYNDNTLNVTDLVAITNIALEMRGKEIRPAINGFQFAPAVALPGIDIPLTARVVEMNADRTIVAIAIDNDEAIATMQLDLDLPDGVMLESASVTDRSHMLSATCGTSPEGLPRVMLSSFGMSDINAGSGDVLYLTLRGKARQGELMSLTNAVMSERNLIEHGASGNLTLDLNDYTGVSTVVYDHVNIYGENGSIIIESPVEGTAQLVRINGISREVKVEPGRNVYPVTMTRGDIIIASFKGTTRKIQF